MVISNQEAIFTASEMKAVDQAVIESSELTGLLLMKRAANASLKLLSRTWPTNRSIQILCGVGNNGGDGYLLGELASSRGWDVIIWQVGNPSRISGDAALAREHALNQGVTEKIYVNGTLDKRGVIVDAMLGTGFQGELRPLYKAAALEANRSGLPILALDLPSGLNADTGSAAPDSVNADHTITFVGKKRGALTALGPDLTGNLTLDKLGLTISEYDTIRPNCFELDLKQLLKQIEVRRNESHKGTFGSLLVVGGNESMGGAVTLAGEAALRSGAGLVRILTIKEHVAPILSRVPELIVSHFRTASEMQSIMNQSDVILVGPGLGRDAWAKELLEVVLSGDCPVVLDADALNLLSEKQIVNLPSKAAISTPHPGEASRLLGLSTNQIQKDRFAAVASLQELLGGVVVLKGNGTIIFDGKYFLICVSGNPGMATAGMGDVLAGVIASFLAQGLKMNVAASLAVSLHSAAADKIGQKGVRGMIASDLMVPMRALLG